MANPLLRADFNTAKQANIVFSDFPINFDMTPSGDLARIVNSSAVIQSITNIILTNVGERLYNSTIGSTVYLEPFENASPIQNQLIENSIILAIQQNEPRATVLGVQVSSDDNDNYNIVVAFQLINSPTPMVLPLLVSRDR